MMDIPEGQQTFELKSSIIWISGEGIVYSKAKSEAPTEQSNEEIMVELKKWRKIVGDEKICLVSESNPNSKPPKKEQRDFIAQEIENLVKAMAIVTSSPLTRMIANLFFGFKPPSYPVKMFTNEKDATVWIRNYL